jgi:peptidoglycan hydrolase CwlO-like protein/3D (Asp-Asp-Asp) domain-containing protein
MGDLFMKNKRIMSVFLASLLLSGSALPCYASTQDKISDTKAQKQETQSTLNQTQNKISNLETKKSELEDYLTDLNQQLSDLSSSLSELQKQSEDKQKELQEVEAELEAAKKLEKEQYEAMKVRIQYMYEKNNMSYIEVLLASENFADFLNRADNIVQISKYDRNKFAEYQETKENIAKQEEAVKTEQQEIEKLQEESTAKQEEVEELVASTYDKINTYASQITASESEAQSLLAKVNSQEETLNGLLKQAKDEEAAATLAAKKQEQAAQKAEQTALSKSDNETSSKKDSKAEDKKEEASKENTSKEESKKEETAKEDSQESNSSDSSQGEYLGKFKLTAYCNCEQCCGQWANGLTASGTTPSEGRTVAMGGVPFGTKLLINGNVYTVEDRGTAYGHVDVYMNNHSDTYGFGVKYADVYRLN